MGNEPGCRSLARILVLGVMFYLVALCPNVAMAFAVFTSGTGVYSFLWWNEIFHENQKKQ
jgi:hypothetical protein